MNIYLVRHGESEGNAAQFTQTPDTPLSEKGKKQVRLLAKRLKKIDVDLIYSSHIKRAKQSAEIISKIIHKPIEFWEDLQEMRQPKEIQGVSHLDEENQRIRKLIAEKHHMGNWKYSDEETFEELKNRCQRILDHLFAKHLDQNILCISHGGVIRMIATLAVFGENLTAHLFWEFWHHTWHENTGITQIEYSAQYGWSLMTWNDTTHL